ncbi:MAG: hypothetical protein IIV81_03120 [Clostridia bacterium]|nr:hypothetical protein [Clostridia bacterium]
MNFTEFSENVKNVSELPDRPDLENGYTSDMLKGIFDKAGEDIKSFINGVLLKELTSAADIFSGADRIGSGTIDIIEGKTVQEKLQSIAGHIKGLANGTLPDGSVTPDKFSPEIADFLTSASIRREILTQVGESTFEAPRDGIYKITMVGGGAGGGQDPDNGYHSCGGGSGAGVILWCEMKKGDICTIRIGKGGKGFVYSDGNISVATEGEDTELYINDTLRARAKGGTLGLNVRALGEGGDLNFSGGFPKVGDYFKSSTSPAVMFSIGGDSILGNGAAFREDSVGYGGGGFASRRLDNQNYRNGTDGGSGAAVIEYMK